MSNADKFTSVLVAALEKAWAAIRAAHPDLPPAVIVLASGSSPRATKLGHWAGARWKAGNDKAGTAEVLISGEGLKLGASEVFGTLLHEAAHGLAHAREINDTSREGRYHNAKYKRLAEEVGLDVSQGSQGWTETCLTKITAVRWARMIAAIEKAMQESYRMEEVRTPKKTPGRMLLAVCSCKVPRRLRIARGVFELATIHCGGCESPFQLQ